MKKFLKAIAPIVLAIISIALFAVLVYFGYAVIALAILSTLLYIGYIREQSRRIGVTEALLELLERDEKLLRTIGGMKLQMDVMDKILKSKDEEEGNGVESKEGK